ncbi:MAG TPA: oligosaccharide flippase family protein, partial [Usitatibacter sp.]|nr:oligosaccharide flippase family protein [Usitatibacter sp.]
MPSPARPHAASAWLNVTAKLGGTVLSFALYLAMARLLDPRGFADVAVALAWITVGSALCSVSLPLALVRFVPEQLAAGRPDLARGAAQFSIALTVGLAAAAAIVAAVLAGAGAVKLRPELVRTALLSAAILVPSVLLLDFAGLLTALKRALASELLVNVTRPLLLLVLLGWLWLQSRALLSASTVMAAYLAASLVMVPVCASYCVRTLPTEMSRAPAIYDVRGWMRIAGGFMAAALASALYERVDLLVMGWTAPGAEIAAYAVAARFGQTVVVAASAANAVMAPYLVERLPQVQRGQHSEVQPLLRDTARTALYVSLVALAAFGLAGPLILKLFGPAYERAYVPLVIIAAGQVVAACFGPAAGVATLAGAPRIAVMGLITGAVLNACLNMALVPHWGAVGAAIATASAITCASVVAWTA